MVSHAGRKKNAAAKVDLAAGGWHFERVTLSRYDRSLALDPGQCRLGLQLAVGIVSNDCRVNSVLPEKPVGMAGRTVAPLCGIKHKHRPVGA